MTTAQEARRLGITTLATQLAGDAVAAAGRAQMDTPEWRFYHGVETAAQHMLHPELQAVREGTAWLDAEAPAFRDGFLRASALLATAATLADPPQRLPLPAPSARA